MSMPRSAASVALDWIERGFFVVPIPYREKKPVLESWQALRIGKADIPRYFNGQPQNVGVLLGEPYGAADIDLDTPEAIAAAAQLAPETGLVFGRASKLASHRFYRADPPVRSRRYRDPIGGACLVELRCMTSDGTVGLQTVVPGSVHKETGEPIRFEPGFDREPANIDAAELEHVVARIAAAALLARHWPARGRHSCELALAGVLARGGWPEAEAVAFAVATYKAVPTHDRRALARVETSVRSTYEKAAKGGEITGFPNLVRAVGQDAAKKAANWLRIDRPISLPRVSAGATDLITQPFNDYGNAQRLIALYGDTMRYCHEFTAWLVFDGRHWEIDRRDAARVLIQNTMLAFAKRAFASRNEAAQRFAGSCLNTQRLTAALREAQPHLAIDTAALDTDPDLLNFTNGTVNLKTGALESHRRTDLITKLVKHAYRPEAEYPHFRRFLARVVPGLEDYLQRAIGYSITGHTSEKAVFVCHGCGDNGKTTLLSLVRDLLGDDYAVLLQIDTLMVRQESNNAQADLADLRGARFVMTSETEKGQRLADGKLKRITQGMGRIKAVRKYENPIQFPESHKLWLDCNHKPLVRGSDNAIWNRLHLIPFNVVIPAEEIDRELPAKLRAEAEGIIAWAVAGAVRWHSEELGRPDPVERAGREWRDESDHVRRFIDEACVVGEILSSGATSLYVVYSRWCEESGERALNKIDFGNALEDRGFVRTHSRTGSKYGGIAPRIGNAGGRDGSVTDRDEAL